MKIKDFIEKAIEGGWYKGYTPTFMEDGVLLDPDGDAKVALVNAEILLDPFAWQAVGKQEGWGASVCKLCGEISFCDHANSPRILPWKYRMHRMIDALAEGRSIDDFLKTL